MKNGVFLGKASNNKSGAKVLFDLTEKRKGDSEKKIQLENFPIVKCVAGEKILCVQRQHPIEFIVPLGLRIIVVLLIFFFLVFISPSIQQILPFALNNSTFITYVILTILATLFVIETFNFLTWYYQFYIITNKAIIHRYSFRIGGPYSEVVFGDKMHIQDITRGAPNIIYDFLKIQDVYVYFHEIERKEPFIFKTPHNAQEIEDLLDSLQDNAAKVILKTNAI